MNVKRLFSKLMLVALFAAMGIDQANAITIGQMRQREAKRRQELGIEPTEREKEVAKLFEKKPGVIKRKEAVAPEERVPVTPEEELKKTDVFRVATKISSREAKGTLTKYKQINLSAKNKRRDFVKVTKDVIHVLAQKRESAFLGGRLRTTQFRNDNMIGPMVTFAARLGTVAKEIKDNKFAPMGASPKEALDLAKAALGLIAVRVHAEDPAVQAVKSHLNKLDAVNVDMLKEVLKPFYPSDKMNRLHDDMEKLKSLLKK